MRRTKEKQHEDDWAFIEVIPNEKALCLLRIWIHIILIALLSHIYRNNLGRFTFPMFSEIICIWDSGEIVTLFPVPLTCNLWARMWLQCFCTSLAITCKLRAQKLLHCCFTFPFAIITCDLGARMWLLHHISKSFTSSLHFPFVKYKLPIAVFWTNFYHYSVTLALT